jgi:ABC-type amino acid transport substrate-binding protein
VPLPNSLAALNGETFGLVLGYRYPELDTLLNKHYVRDDAPNMHSNIQKLATNRLRYAVVDNLIYQYEKKLDPRLLPLKKISISSFSARCGFSPTSKIPFSDIDAAIHKLIKNGVVEHILSSYR